MYAQTHFKTVTTEIKKNPNNYVNVFKLVTNYANLWINNKPTSKFFHEVQKTNNDLLPSPLSETCMQLTE